ncbi:MAG: DUF29 domain-containing protein [Thiocapsa sp.]|uniref:DUF29 domain-containing protein n=1 Tax=Thiocapsa sp. TaxID=2024551 RepID=UPI001BCC284C|nr:DUF29 domain-containing protein [Thiocapsa sp.]QVL47149.1 MAG: DUF29 domain-containing protein [Thiocapsa sp.]
MTRHRDLKSAHEPQAPVYEQDLVAWAFANARLLREGRFESLDVENIAEELEDLGRSEKRALASHLRVLLLHLLKWQAQPARRGPSWRRSIRNARQEIEEIVAESPSLAQRLPEMIEQAYPKALESAIDETGLPSSRFQPRCPYRQDELLSPTFWP